jgi:F-type H+-transporting ATPase subunit b
VTDALIQPDPGLFIWTIVTFLVLVWLLAKFAWRPLLGALEKREQMIAAAVDDARRTKEELERVQQDSERLLVEARREADSLVSRARGDAERLRAELAEKAKADAVTITRNAEKQIQHETARAVQQIRHEAVEISLAIASKLLRRNVSRVDNEGLIQETVRQLETREQ